MNISKVLLGIFFSILAVALIIFGYFFYTTGGTRLAIVVVNYLIPNIPNKKLSWVDFTNRSPTDKISGFYAGGDKNGFSLWTLSGLKRFNNMTGTSIYISRDVCTVVKTLKKDNAPQKSVTVKDQVTGDIAAWERMMKKEYFVTIIRLPNENNNLIDKVWSVNAKYTIIGQIDNRACN